ncbi:hypothetical protein SAMN05421766_10591 [Zobellia uliginosa]|uniref:Uncharacterized protein n=1 Tax=Zobellia uliginosa TaxID=143224 RepID=A0ABY1L0U1_9FLAO|nr:hypothetical protein [Zobellia uliginosa]SIS94327.1 hypothetical protein SAMN05421766_10591 [Zobellia uliginosa]
MKYIYPTLLCICLAVAAYYNNKSNKAHDSGHFGKPEQYTLLVQRGAFHFDSFKLTRNKISHIPGIASNFETSTHNNNSQTFLDSLQTIGFFKKLEASGFWDLESYYGTDTSCTSQLIVTLRTGKKSKTVICDDYQSDCPELLKYIEKKVVELEGNHLKRTYLPG